MPSRVKILQNIPKEDLEAMIKVHKADGAKVAWKEQANGQFRIEALFDDAPQQDTVRSVVSGDLLHQA